METMTNTTGGPDSPREIVERMIDILRGELDADRLDNLGVRLALVATIAEELEDLRAVYIPFAMDGLDVLEGEDGPDNDSDEGGE